MQKSNLRKVKLIMYILSVIGIVMAVIGVQLNYNPMFMVPGFAFIVAAVIYDYKKYRCPYCHKYLGRFCLNYCPHCGKDVYDLTNEDNYHDEENKTKEC